MKDEPTRCLKCHKYGHIARTCEEKDKTCGTCGAKGHRTDACQEKSKTHCVSCKKDDNCSWDRSCPTFIKKCEEYNKKHPENTLPYFPSVEPWTWIPNNGPEITIKPSSQHTRKMEQKMKQQSNKTGSSEQGAKATDNSGNPTSTQ